jgi:hypothetical protein
VLRVRWRPNRCTRDAQYKDPWWTRAFAGRVWTPTCQGTGFSGSGSGLSNFYPDPYPCPSLSAPNGWYDVYRVDAEVPPSDSVLGHLPDRCDIFSGPILSALTQEEGKGSGVKVQVRGIFNVFNHTLDQGK